MRAKWALAAVPLAAAFVTVIFLTTMAPRSAAQDATPVATPITGGVPCTDLFGIAAGNACVLFLQGSQDAGPLDVYVDGALVIAGATFGSLGEFVPVVAGERQFLLVPSGASPEAAVLNSRVNLTEAVAYEVVALGPVAEIRLQALPVDTRPLEQEAARLRVVHGSPDAPAVDLAVTGGVPLIGDVQPGRTSASLTMPSATYALEIREAGATDVLLPLPGTVLVPNTTYSFYVIGSVAEGSLGVTLVPVLIPPELVAAATPVA